MRYGIFVAFSPGARLEGEGLGRYLAAFVKAAVAHPGHEVHIAVPSWGREPVRRLLVDAGVNDGAYRFLGPTELPALLRLYHLRERSRRRAAARARRAPRSAALFQAAARMLKRPAAHVAGTRSVGLVVGLAAGIGILGAVLSPVAGAAWAARTLWRLIRRGAAWLRARALGEARKAARAAAAAFVRHAGGPVQRTIQRALADAVYAREIALMVDMINARPEIEAWYSPTAFWPEFNAIRRPRLMCVPDIVVSEFPIHFAQLGAVANAPYDNVLAAIGKGTDFVTYSERVKWDVLVARFDIPADRIRVVRHAASVLSQHIDVVGFEKSEIVSVNLCRTLARQALAKATVTSRTANLRSIDFEFLFYASKFRPSKNIITLLRAYEFLLRKRFISHKLVLTGDSAQPPVRQFIETHQLSNDVLCFVDLSEPELAAFYKLASLAVNPSLSEGGMPFTFSEALSVGTPVIMGDIEVTREIITDPALRAATLFDPYDWRAIAAKIEWALANRAGLLRQQAEFYAAVLAPRTWDHVVAEHVGILSDLVRAPPPAATA